MLRKCTDVPACAEELQRRAGLDRRMRIRYKLGLGMLALFLLYALFRSIRTMVLSGKGMNICPQCGSPYIHLSGTRAYVDLLFRIFGCLPYRCRVCSIRFYRPKVSSPPAARTAPVIRPAAMESPRGSIKDA